MLRFVFILKDLLDRGMLGIDINVLNSFFIEIGFPLFPINFLYPFVEWCMKKSLL